jgi:hypothetical protein
MSYLVVRNDAEVLSRATPHGPLVWLALTLTECTEYRYALTFDRHAAATICAGMHAGAHVHTIGEFDEKGIEQRRQNRATCDGRAPGAMHGHGAERGSPSGAGRLGGSAPKGRPDRSLHKPLAKSDGVAPRPSGYLESNFVTCITQMRR